jgi:hypothetical protein
MEKRQPVAYFSCGYETQKTDNLWKVKKGATVWD